MDSEGTEELNAANDPDDIDDTDGMDDMLVGVGVVDGRRVGRSILWAMSRCSSRENFDLHNAQYRDTCRMGRL